MNIIIGNFGNHSLASMQCLIEKGLTSLHFIYVETGWAAASWSKRVALCSNYAQSQGVGVHSIKAQASFSEMVIDRKQFPSSKFQWCASFLKGLAILSYLDEIDPACEARIVSGKRRQDSRRNANLEEFECSEDLYQSRMFWHPLWQTADDEFALLIERAGFKPLMHQSLECSPCIHTRGEDLNRMDTHSLSRLDALEKEVGQTMFHQPIKHLCNPLNASKEQPSLNLRQFDLGCGAAWGCGE